MFAPANAARFTLEIPAVRHRFKVFAFDGDETISGLYAFKVGLVSQNPLLRNF